LRALHAAGTVDIALHGWTHMHPNRAEWAAAADRYDDVGWFRELGTRAEPILAQVPLGEHPLAKGIAAIERYFGARPSTLICPGDAWTDAALQVALALGIQAVSSYYFALRHADRLCWAQHVCAPYLDEANAAAFDAGLPVVGYFHDRDLALQGVDWLARQLDAWSHAGARRFVPLRDVTAAAQLRLDVCVSGGECMLEVRSETPIASMASASLPVRFHLGKPEATRSIEIVASKAAARYRLAAATADAHVPMLPQGGEAP
jgi:hypothetical protein